MQQTAKTRPRQTAKRQRADTPRGLELLNDPARNKGTAFTEEERLRFGFEGPLPPSAESLDRQVERVFGHLGPSRLTSRPDRRYVLIPHYDCGRSAEDVR